MTSILFFCAHGRPCPNFIGFAAVSAALGAAFLVLPRSRRLWRGFFGTAAVSATLGAVFLVLPRSRRLWRGFFGTAAVSATLGAVFLVLPRSRRLWRGFFGTAAVSAALGAVFLVLPRSRGSFGAAFLVLAQSRRLWRSFFDVSAASLTYCFHWFSREKYCRKIQPHLQKFCVQDGLCRGGAVLYELRLPYKKKQAVQPPVRFFSQTAPAAVYRLPDSLAPQKRQQAECSARLFAFSCRAAKAAAD